MNGLIKMHGLYLFPSASKEKVERPDLKRNGARFARIIGPLFLLRELIQSDSPRLSRKRVSLVENRHIRGKIIHHCVIFVEQQLNVDLPLT